MIGKLKLESDKIAFQALLKYALGLEKQGYVGADVLVAYYKDKLKELAETERLLAK